MDFRFTPEEEAFREELVTFLEESLPDTFLHGDIKYRICDSDRDARQESIVYLSDSVCGLSISFAHRRSVAVTNQEEHSGIIFHAAQKHRNKTIALQILHLPLL